MIKSKKIFTLSFLIAISACSLFPQPNTLNKDNAKIKEIKIYNQNQQDLELINKYRKNISKNSINLSNSLLNKGIKKSFNVKATEGFTEGTVTYTDVVVKKVEDLGDIVRVKYSGTLNISGLVSEGGLAPDGVTMSYYIKPWISQELYTSISPAICSKPIVSDKFKVSGCAGVNAPDCRYSEPFTQQTFPILEDYVDFQKALVVKGMNSYELNSALKFDFDASNISQEVALGVTSVNGNNTDNPSLVLNIGSRTADNTKIEITGMGKTFTLNSCTDYVTDLTTDIKPEWKIPSDLQKGNYEAKAYMSDNTGVFSNKINITVIDSNDPVPSSTPAMCNLPPPNTCQSNTSVVIIIKPRPVPTPTPTACPKTSDIAGLPDVYPPCPAAPTPTPPIIIDPDPSVPPTPVPTPTSTATINPNPTPVPSGTNNPNPTPTPTIIPTPVPSGSINPQLNQCPSSVNLPKNSFSPNADGLNEILKININSNSEWKTEITYDDNEGLLADLGIPLSDFTRNYTGFGNSKIEWDGKNNQNKLLINGDYTIKVYKKDNSVCYTDKIKIHGMPEMDADFTVGEPENYSQSKGFSIKGFDPATKVFEGCTKIPLQAYFNVTRQTRPIEYYTQFFSFESARLTGKVKEKGKPNEIYDWSYNFNTSYYNFKNSDEELDYHYILSNSVKGHYTKYWTPILKNGTTLPKGTYKHSGSGIFVFKSGYEKIKEDDKFSNDFQIREYDTSNPNNVIACEICNQPLDIKLKIKPLLEKRYEWQNSIPKVNEIAEKVIAYAKVKDKYGIVKETLFAHSGKTFQGIKSPTEGNNPSPSVFRKSADSDGKILDAETKLLEYITDKYGKNPLNFLPNNRLYIEIFSDKPNCSSCINVMNDINKHLYYTKAPIENIEYSGDPFIRGIKITDVATETALANINSCTNIN